jgi:hypothetical protein
MLVAPLVLCHLKSLSSINFRFLFTKNISGSCFKALTRISKFGFSIFAESKRMSPIPNCRLSVSSRVISSIWESLGTTIYDLCENILYAQAWPKAVISPFESILISPETISVGN